MTPKDEVEALIARIAMGDRKAFRILYDRSSAKLYGVALRILKDEGPAQDTLQEVYVRVWNRAGSYRANGSSPMTWLITITRSAAIDRLRKARAAGLADVAVEIAERLYDPNPSVEDLIALRQEAQQLQACLRELPPDRVEMVRQAYLQGFTYAEIAEASQTKPNTVRNALRRSLMRLKECLSQ